MRTILIIVLLCLAASAYAQVSASDVTSNSKTNTFVVKGKTITDYSTTTTPMWRFTHDGVVLLLVPYFSGGVTYTPYKVVECKTLDLATNEIVRLRLKVTDEQWEAIDRVLLEKKDEKSPVEDKTR